MYPLGRKEDLVIQKSGDEVLIYDLKTNKAISLNKTSALIWKSCDGEKSPHQIRLQLQKELSADISEDLVWFALEQLAKENLIDSNDDISLKFAGLSRREVIKKIGLGAAVSLPIIASLTAPAAIDAQSVVCNTGVTCTCTISGMDANTGAPFGAGNCTSSANTGGCNTAAGCRCMIASLGNPIVAGTCST